MASRRTAAEKSILVTRDDERSRDWDPNLIQAATVEVLRACACAAETVLIPATREMLPLAAVITHDLRQTRTPSDERPVLRHGRFVPIEWRGRLDDEFLRPFLRADLGGDARDPVEGNQILPWKQALEDYPPSTVVALTDDDMTLDVLRSFGSRPRVLYFRSLLGERRIARMADRLGNEFIDLEHRMPVLDVRDPETGRSDDDGLEPFIPFGVLLQFALWPPVEPQQ